MIWNRSRNERALKARVREYLDFLGPDTVWYYFAQDRYTSGIADVVGCCLGKFFVIELKRPGGRRRPLQQHTIDLIRRARGHGMTAETLEEVVAFMIGLMYGPTPHDKCMGTVYPDSPAKQRGVARGGAAKSRRG